MYKITKDDIGKHCRYEGKRWRILGISKRFDGTWLRIRANGIEKSVNIIDVSMDDAE